MWDLFISVLSIKCVTTLHVWQEKNAEHVQTQSSTTHQMKCPTKLSLPGFLLASLEENVGCLWRENAASAVQNEFQACSLFYLLSV